MEVSFSIVPPCPAVPENSSDTTQDVPQYSSPVTSCPSTPDIIAQDDLNDPRSEDSEDAPALNTVDDLGKGIIHVSDSKTEFTILVVGETGTGKTTVLSLIANILQGNTPKTYKKYHEESNEAGGSAKHSQTNNAKLYQFVSKNGITVRILDTPGLADTRGIAQDEQHKESIARAIRDHITVVNAVIILANGTVPRLGVATDYALSTLSSMFPKTLADNIGFLFTNVSSPLSWNFDEQSLPDALRNDHLYLLDNPVAMRDKYLGEKQKMERQRKPQKRLLNALEQSVEDGHKKALGEFVKIFDFIDSRSPQPTKDILSLYAQSQDIEKKISVAFATMEQMASKTTTLKRIEKETDGTTLTIKQYATYQSTIMQNVYKQVDTPHHNTLCATPKCYHNCHKHCHLSFSLDPKGIRNCKAFKGGRVENCTGCEHPYTQHRHYNVMWELKEDEQITIDEDAKKKYDDAVEEKEKQEMGMAQLKKSIADMDMALAEAITKVGQLVEEYAKLSLSGNFAGQVEKSVSLLDLNLQTMRSNGTDIDTIKSVEKALKRMEEKLDLVKKAKKVRELVTDFKNYIHHY
ncbi:uncharacterized protein FIBRA_09357 [Fibroporia radiculosa]|uniref:AIG1-type G domain-containing protein n=1 Tax=Fibroporia radiculosa TaxID=599839 RepID=J7SCZ0_9APHY|nr:uncharacterized protein FIBRA_09357 [Fibroporia radiculosa]CCM07038.1 predicted protein [Fibroporia radiculosa]